MRHEKVAPVAGARAGARGRLEAGPQHARGAGAGERAPSAHRGVHAHDTGLARTSAGSCEGTRDLGVVGFEAEEAAGDEEVVRVGDAVAGVP